MSAMAVPFFDLQRQYESIRTEIEPALARVLADQHFILGPEVEALESELAAYLGVRYTVGVSSGTDALLVALMALGIGPGDEVIVPSYSFFASAGVVARLGAVPVFADIDPASFNLDPQKAADLIGPKTRALMPVHLFGQCADLEPLLELARDHGLPVVEDAAQTIGAAYRGRMAGSLGDLGCFSFFPTKNLGAFGDGGLVAGNDRDLMERVRRLRVHGASPKYHHALVGGNFRLDALQAAVLRVKLKHLDGWAAARRVNAGLYAAGLADLAGPKLILPAAVHGPGARDHVFNQYTVLLAERDRVRGLLAERGIGTEIYYPLPLHLQECFSGLGYRPGDLPAAEHCARQALSLPVFPELEEGQAGEVIAALRAVLA